MIGLDTNVVVRYLTHDDSAQAAAVTKLFASLSADDPGFLSLTVIVETVWVLRGSYGLKKGEIADVLEMLLRSKEIIVERADLVVQALRKFRAARADFSDCLIERCGSEAGCEYTVTFDKRASDAGMKLLS